MTTALPTYTTSRDVIDYPLVAPDYAAARSAMAKELGLGRKLQQRKKPAARGGAKKR